MLKKLPILILLNGMPNPRRGLILDWEDLYSIPLMIISLYGESLHITLSALVTILLMLIILLLKITKQTIFLQRLRSIPAFLAFQFYLNTVSKEKQALTLWQV